MHPAFYYWWKHARSHHSHGPEAHDACGSEGGERGGFGRHGHDEHEHGGRHGHGFHGRHDHESRFAGHDDGSPFGVRRPLRFLAHKLDLTDDQVGQLARILNELKTERAQAEVDHQRTVASFADAIEAESFDEKRAEEGGKLRVSSADRIRAAVVKALSQIHGVLTKEQRQKFAYLVRTGVVSM